jgi:hypothetical protein
VEQEGCLGLRFGDWVCVTEPIFCYEFRKENGKKEERLRREEWILLKEMACSRRLLSYLGIRGAKNLQVLTEQNTIRIPKSSHPLLLIQHKN